MISFAKKQQSLHRVNLAEDGQGSAITNTWWITGHGKEKTQDVKHVKQCMDLCTL